MTLDPASFPFFLILFSLSIVGGTYLLYAYYRNWLLIINAVVLYLAGLRVASEYYLQTLTTFAEVQAYAPWHILPINILLPLQWLMIVYYTNPFRGLQYARVFHWLLAVGFIAIPFIGHNYYNTIDPRLYVFSPERIGGYWRYSVITDFWYYPIYTIHTQVALLMIYITLIVGIIRNPRRRLLQFILLLSYLVTTYVYFKVARHDGLIIPNIGILFVVHGVIVSWYVSNYRMFRSNYNLITKSLYGSITDLAIATDPEGRITHSNPAANTFFGNSLHHMKAELARIRQEYANGQEIALQNAGNQERVVRYRTAPIEDGDSLLGHTILFTDLTEIRRQEDKLRELNATKDRLFSIIGHDLRRPALAFRGIGSKINHLSKKNDLKRLNLLGKNLEQEAITLNNLLDNLLNWALQQRQVLPYNPVAVTPYEIVEILAAEYGVLLASKHINLSNDVPADLQLVADKNVLRTILRNLLDNASKFSPDGAHITVKAWLEGSFYTISVTNSGVTLDRAEIERLERGEGRAKEKQGALNKNLHGFGLHLVRELLDLHGGKLSLTSQQKEGVTVQVGFPRMEAVAESSTPAGG